MAENQNYIGVAMGLDVTDLKAGLSEANKQIQLANSEFKAASSGMDDWRKSTEGLSAKVKQLDSVLNSQKAKLSGLKAEYKKVAEEQGENSEAARKLQVQINNQQSVVNKTQKEFDNYSDTLKKAKDGTVDLKNATVNADGSIKDFGDTAKGAGENVEGGFGGKAGAGIAGGIAAIGAAAVAAVGSFLSLAESTREFREEQAKLNAAFEQAGQTAETASSTYNKLFRVIGESDQSVEAAQQIALLADSEKDAAKWAELATGVVGTFGDALQPETFYESANETLKLGEATGAYVQMLEGTGVNVEDFNAKLAACTTESEKQAYILSVAEKSMGAAGAAYEEGAADILAANEATAALNEATATLGAIAEPIMTTLKTLAAELLTEITPFVELIGTGLRGAFEGTAGAAGTLAEGLTGILDVLVNRVNEMLPTVIGIVSELVPSIINTLLDAIPQVIGVILQAIPQILDALSTMLPQLLQKIAEMLPPLLEQIISALPKIIEAILTLVSAIVKALPKVITTLLDAVPSLIDTIIGVILEAIPMIVEAAIELFNAIIDAIPVIVQSLITNLPKIINTIIDGLLEALPMVLQAAIKLLMTIIDALPTIIGLLVRDVPIIVSTIISTLLSRLPELISGAIKLLMGIVKAIPTILSELKQKAPQIVKAIIDGIKGGTGEMKKAGKNLLEGIWQGIKNGASWLKNKITGFAGNVADWFKETFKINSPSKLMEDEVGRYIGEGVGVGVVDSIPTVKKQLGKFAGFVTDNLGGIKSGLTVDSSGASANNGRATGRGNTVVNAGITVNYNGTLSRKQIKQLENDNYTAIRTRLKAEGAF